MEAKPELCSLRDTFTPAIAGGSCDAQLGSGQGREHRYQQIVGEMARGHQHSRAEAEVAGDETRTEAKLARATGMFRKNS